MQAEGEGTGTFHTEPLSVGVYQLSAAAHDAVTPPVLSLGLHTKLSNATHKTEEGTVP